MGGRCGIQAPYLIIYVASPDKTKMLSGGVRILLLFAVVFFNMVYPFLLRKWGYTAKQLLFLSVIIRAVQLPVYSRSSPNASLT
jgi:hypothetical protein